VKSRVLAVEQSKRQLVTLGLRQELLFNEALKCIEFGICRAAIVSAWMAFEDGLEEKLASDGLVKVRAVRPKWNPTTSIHEYREEYGEFQMIEVAYEVRLIPKGAKKFLHGQLSLRNDCAHSSNYDPGVNEALGYVSGLIQRIKEISGTKF
jgi:hypothetical protein